MNKRIRKKHKWLGAKRAGANYCANEIARHIGRKVLYSGITPKPSYVLSVRRHVRGITPRCLFYILISSNFHFGLDELPLLIIKLRLCILYCLR